jgi:hypothetical protein
VESQYLDGERLGFGSIAAVDGQRRLGVGPGDDQPKPATRWSRSTPPSNPLTCPAELTDIIKNAFGQIPRITTTLDRETPTMELRLTTATRASATPRPRR